MPKRNEGNPAALCALNPASGQIGESMVRLGAVALLALSSASFAQGSPPAIAPDPDRSFQMPRPDGDRFDTDGRIGRTQIAPNALFGFGMFGLNSEKSPLRAPTGRELDEPKQRRAALGFSMSF